MRWVSCDNCLCHLHVCDADCCKEFRIKITIPRPRYKRGDVVYIKNDDDDDFQYYAKLRGFPTDKNGVTHVLLDDFVQRGGYLYIYSTCFLLNKDNTCSVHGTSAQPRICEFPNKHDKGGDKVYLTSRCVYK